MNEIDGKQDKNTISNQTHIGSVTGQVHTGSGDINVQNFVAGNSISNKDELLAALREFKAELDTARRAGLPEDTSDDAVTEIEAAEREANKEAPTSDRVIKRLERARDILLTGVSTATAASTAVEKLNSLIQSTIDHAHKIFGG